MTRFVFILIYHLYLDEWQIYRCLWVWNHFVESIFVYLILAMTAESRIIYEGDNEDFRWKTVPFLKALMALSYKSFLNLCCLCSSTTFISDSNSRVLKKRHHTFVFPFRKHKFLCFDWIVLFFDLSPYRMGIVSLNFSPLARKQLLKNKELLSLNRFLLVLSNLDFLSHPKSL